MADQCNDRAKDATMHLRNKLNVTKIAALTTPNVYSDGGGLYLRVRKSGTKSWLYIGMLNGKRREIGLGSVLDVSLADARKKATDLRTAQLAGIDPAEARKQVHAVAKQIPTFGEMATDLIDGIEGGFSNEKHRKQWRSTITTYAAQIIDKPVDQVTATDIVALLQPIWLEKAETASRVRQRIERFLDGATVKGHRSGDNPARLKGNLEFLLPRKAKGEAGHHEAMPFALVADFMVKLRKRPAVTARALEFAILTAARTGEVIGMRWEEVDLDKTTWTVPAERMKAKRAHTVPLSDAALTILRNLRPAEPEPRDLVFEAPKGGMLSNMAMLALLKRMEVNVTVHGFRSTFRDWAGDMTNFAQQDIEMALAHTIHSKTERAYRRGDALEKRRALMQAWAEFCKDAKLEHLP
jgi:integrase